MLTKSVRSLCSVPSALYILPVSFRPFGVGAYNWLIRCSKPLDVSLSMTLEQFFHGRHQTSECWSLFPTETVEKYALTEVRKREKEKQRERLEIQSKGMGVGHRKDKQIHKDSQTETEPDRHVYIWRD